MITKPLLIAVVGPTASGKSELAVKLAKKYHGEVISADSRQVYRGMDIGSGKIEGKIQGFQYTYKSIPHYGIDIASPRSQYSVARFQKYADKVITEIIKRGKVPIICGGTGYWIDAVVYNQHLPAVKPNSQLRKKLEKLSTTELFAKLKKLDPTRAQNIDAKNPRRLIRALEIVLSTGKPVPVSSMQTKYDIIWLGITHDKEALEKRIDKRLGERLNLGMTKEIEKLRKGGLSWKRLEDFGLEYKYIALYLQSKLSHEQMVEQLSTAIKQYAKRQITWFKRNKNIHWIKNSKEASQIISCEIKKQSR